MRTGRGFVTFIGTQQVLYLGETTVGRTLLDFLKPLIKLNIKMGQRNAGEDVDQKKHIIIIFFGTAPT